jgi:hypothetical protein
MVELPFPLYPISPEHYNAIGNVVAKCADLESLLDTFLCYLVGGEADDVACVTAQFVSPWPRIEAVMAIFARRKDEEGIAALSAMQNRMESAICKRNRIAHAAWTMTSDGQPSYYRTAHRRTPIFTYSVMTIAEIETLAIEFSNLYDELLDLVRLRCDTLFPE